MGYLPLSDQNYSVRTSIQRRLAENNGIFDVNASTGVASPPKAPAAPKADSGASDMPKDKPKTAGKDSNQEADGLIAAADAIRTANAGLETASAYLRAYKAGDAGDQLDKARAGLLHVGATIKTGLVELAQKDPAVADRVRSWLMDVPKGGPYGPKASPAVETPPPATPAPAPAPAPAPPPAPAPAPGAAAPAPVEDIPIQPGESFLRSVDKALFEQGVTKERPQPKKMKTQVWDQEKTGTKKQWYTKGVEGHGYGSGGKFNNH